MSQHGTETTRGVDVVRRIGADPTSAVLLLVAPTAAEWWPGVELESVQPGDHIKVQLTLPPEVAEAVGDPQTIAGVVRAEAPQRTPTSFVTRFTFSASTIPTTQGVLTLTYSAAEGGETNATIARLTFSVATEPFVQPAFVEGVARSAEEFLANFAAAAENRSRAA
jgi:hypothetical protein